MNFFKKFWPTILLVGNVVGGVFFPPLWAAHPTVLTVVSSVVGIIGHFLPPPTQQ